MSVVSLLSSMSGKKFRLVFGSLENKTPYYAELRDSLNPDIQKTLLFLVRSCTPVTGILPISPYTHSRKWKIMVDIVWGTFRSEDMFEWPDCTAKVGVLPNVAIMVVCAYLESLPTPLLYPEDAWHDLGHKLMDVTSEPLTDSFPGFFLKEVQQLRRGLSSGKNLLLDQIVLTILVTARAKGNFNYNACYRMSYLWSQYASRQPSKCPRCKGTSKRLITKGIWHIFHYLAQWGILQYPNPFESVWPPLTPALPLTPAPPLSHSVYETGVDENIEAEAKVEPEGETEEYDREGERRLNRITKLRKTAWKFLKKSSNTSR